MSNVIARGHDAVTARRTTHINDSNFRRHIALGVTYQKLDALGDMRRYKISVGLVEECRTMYPVQSEQHGFI